MAKTIPYVKFDWAKHGGGLIPPPYCPFNDDQLRELQAEWEQSIDPKRPSWPIYLACAISNYDGAPYCQYCGALKRSACDCGPIADNN